MAMPIQRNLDFKISAQNRNVDEMLEYIVEKQRQYKELSKIAQHHCKNRFAKTMAVNFVYKSIKIGCDDIQTFEGTLQLLEKYLESNDDQDDSKLSPSDKECVNYYKALRESFYGRSDDETWGKLRESGLLTVKVVCDLHTTLLEGLPKALDCGKLRKKETGRSGEVQTTYGGKIHHYPPPEVVESRFYGIIDEHNIHIDCEERETSYIFKCAAWLLFELVTLHPFYDGNGRICRLLANYVLSLITPFPVAIYYDNNSSDRNRDHYLNAIVLGQDNSGCGNKEKGCGELASMLVEGAYLGWKDLFQYLKEGGLLGSKPKTGPIVVRKSRTSEIEGKVKRFCHGQLKNISSMEEKILADVRNAVESADTSSMTEPDQHIPKDMEYDEIILQIRIYK